LASPTISDPMYFRSSRLFTRKTPRIADIALGELPWGVVIH
jgi:hypothetical protein